MREGRPYIGTANVMKQFGPLIHSDVALVQSFLVILVMVHPRCSRSSCFWVSTSLPQRQTSLIETRWWQSLGDRWCWTTMTPMLETSETWEMEIRHMCHVCSNYVNSMLTSCFVCIGVSIFVCICIVHPDGILRFLGSEWSEKSCRAQQQRSIITYRSLIGSLSSLPWSERSIKC